MAQMLYRPAAEPNEQVWGLSVEHRVFDESEAAEQLENGWYAHPHDVPTEGATKRGPGRPRKLQDEA